MKWPGLSCRSVSRRYVVPVNLYEDGRALPNQHSPSVDDIELDQVINKSAHVRAAPVGASGAQDAGVVASSASVDRSNSSAAVSIARDERSSAAELPVDHTHESEFNELKCFLEQVQIQERIASSSSNPLRVLTYEFTADPRSPQQSSRLVLLAMGLMRALEVDRSAWCDDASYSDVCALLDSVIRVADADEACVQQWVFVYMDLYLACAPPHLAGAPHPDRAVALASRLLLGRPAAAFPTPLLPQLFLHVCHVLRCGPLLPHTLHALDSMLATSTVKHSASMVEAMRRTYKARLLSLFLDTSVSLPNTALSSSLLLLLGSECSTSLIKSIGVVGASIGAAGAQNMYGCCVAFAQTHLVFSRLAIGAPHALLGEPYVVYQHQLASTVAVALRLAIGAPDVSGSPGLHTSAYVCELLYTLPQLHTAAAASGLEESLRCVLGSCNAYLCAQPQPIAPAAQSDPLHSDGVVDVFPHTHSFLSLPTNRTSARSVCTPEPPSTAGSTATCGAYSVSESVDGKREVNQGGFRWFPAKISSVNIDGTYDIEYTDGEVQVNTSASDLKTSRRKSPPQDTIAEGSLDTSVHSARLNTEAVALVSNISSMSNQHDDFIFVTSSDEDDSPRSEDSANTFAIPTVLHTQASASALIAKRTVKSQVPPIVFDAVSLVPSLQVTSSSHSLSSSLLPIENKSSRSTRLVSGRGESTTRSRGSSIGNITKRVSAATSVLPTSSAQTPPRHRVLRIDSNQVNGASVVHGRHEDLEESSLSVSVVECRDPLGEGLSQRMQVAKCCIVVTALLLHRCMHSLLSTKQLSAEVSLCLFTIREFLEICPVADLDCLYLSASSKGHTHTFFLKLLSSYYFDPCYSELMNTKTAIGEGYFGRVYEVNALPFKCAIKCLSREQSASDPHRILDIFHEINCIHSLRHTTIAPTLIDFGVQETEYWIVTECGWKSVKNWLDSRENERNVEDLHLLLCIYQEVLQIVSTLHASKIIHFDIKADNIIFRFPPRMDNCEPYHNCIQPGCLFLADFGESIQVSSNSLPLSQFYRCRGTLCIQSPEMICISQQSEVRATSTCPTYSSDVWSCGMLLCELLLNRALFGDYSWMDLYVLVCSDTHSLVDLSDVSTALESMYDCDEACTAHGKSQFTQLVCRPILQLLGSILQHSPERRLHLSAISSCVASIRFSIHEYEQPIVEHSSSHVNTCKNAAMVKHTLLHMCSIDGSVVLPKGILLLSEALVFAFGVSHVGAEKQVQPIEVDGIHEYVNRSSFAHITQQQSRKFLSEYVAKFELSMEMAIAEDAFLIDADTCAGLATKRKVLIFTFPAKNQVVNSSDEIIVPVRHIAKTFTNLFEQGILGSDAYFTNIVWLITKCQEASL